jgi:hypothetical protein
MRPLLAVTVKVSNGWTITVQGLDSFSSRQ